MKIELEIHKSRAGRYHWLAFHPGGETILLASEEGFVRLQPCLDAAASRGFDWDEPPLLVS